MKSDIILIAVLLVFVGMTITAVAVEYFSDTYQVCEQWGEERLVYDHINSNVQDMPVYKRERECLKWGTRSKETGCDPEAPPPYCTVP